MTTEGRWISLCCGLGAVETRAMTGAFPPVTRTGGKRAVADHVLEIMGTWPRDFVMVDADPAISEYWRVAFSGQLSGVAEVIRTAPLDGEELWKTWSTEPVPTGDVERLARWIVVQAGNRSGKPVGFTEGSWINLAGFKYNSDHPQNGSSPSRSAVADLILSMGNPRGSVVPMDLGVQMPDFREGDLVLFDPPYQGTTGYGCKFGRERVVEIALAAHEAGARVAVHEAEPILSGGPWRSVDLDRRNRENQRVNFSKQKREVLTVNSDPSNRVHHSMGFTRTEMAPITGPLFARFQPAGVT